jgi:dihydroorotate dehydrogenase electron transfer subunit
MIHNELAEVISNSKIAEGIYETIFHSPEISSLSHPGQFVNILPSADWDYIMRRPMSIASQDNGKISIIFKAIGKGTRIMANWGKDIKVDLIGPLGNYWEGYNSYSPILIGGGVGIAPILNLHNQLKKDQIQHMLIMGARNEQEHFLKHDPKNNIYMSTDDGSLGIKGNVVDAVKYICSKQSLPDDAKIFSCGPPLMMEAVRAYAIDNQLKCDLALETIMACGIGICQGCTIERIVDQTKDHSYRSHFALSCMDGPIFSAEEIVSCG